MRKFHMKKKAAVVVAAAALTVTAAGGAYAFWTASGSGSGSATNASSANGSVALTASFAAGLTPGASEDVTFTGSNAGKASLQVTTIHLDSVSVDSAHSGCNVKDFSMGDVGSGTVVPAGVSGVALAGKGTLMFADSATVSQDACKGAIITLNLTSS